MPPSSMGMHAGYAPGPSPMPGTVSSSAAHVHAPAAASSSGVMHTPLSFPRFPHLGTPSCTALGPEHMGLRPSVFPALSSNAHASMHTPSALPQLSSSSPAMFGASRPAASLPMSAHMPLVSMGHTALPSHIALQGTEAQLREAQARAEAVEARERAQALQAQLDAKRPRPGWSWSSAVQISPCSSRSLRRVQPRLLPWEGGGRCR